VEGSQPQYYIPYAQLPGPQPAVVVRTKIDPLSVEPPVRAAIASLDKDIAVYGVKSFEDLFSASSARERFNAFLFSLFAGLALVLAAIGIYGVVAYSVSQTTHEIGIRLALGARPADVLRLSLWGGLKYVAVGLAIGLVGALTLTRLISTMLYGVKPYDPVCLAASAGAVTVIALLACYLPARRATKVDPMEALRYE
jgi:putative ABC transport system permease protein